MAKKNKGGWPGPGYQVGRPYDIETPGMRDLHTPTTERISYDCQLGNYGAQDMGFGPGKPPLKAIDIEDMAGYRREK